MTPVAGSFHSTRSRRRAASSVPSQTMTMPECCEKPIPTPPPWWSETQVAPLAVLRRALSSGQSETASEPSRMASRSEEHTSELQSLMRISYAVFCLKKQITYRILLHKDNIY